MKCTYIVLGVPGKPYSGEMTPSQLGLDKISPSLERIAYPHRMVSFSPVIICALILGRGVIAALTVTQQPRPLRLPVSCCSSLLNLLPSPFRPTKKTMKNLRMSENRWIFCSKNPFGALCKTSLFLPSLTNSCHT